MTVLEPAGFAQALRQWRERRRVSQLELALRAGTTQRHVSFIERGRSLPGRSMVVRLAEALEVPLRERNALLLAAGYAPAYPETRLDDPSLDPVRIALEHLLDGHMPYPAVLTNRDAQLVASNGAAGALLVGIAPRLLEAPVNLPRVLLHPEGLAPRIDNLTEWGWHVIDGLMRKAERDGNPVLETMISELRQYVPARPRNVPPGHLGFAVPLRLRADGHKLTLLTTLAHFATAIDIEVAELTLEAFLPADAPTAEFFTQSAAGSTDELPTPDDQRLPARPAQSVSPAQALSATKPRSNHPRSLTATRWARELETRFPHDTSTSHASGDRPPMRG